MDSEGDPGANTPNIWVTRDPAATLTLTATPTADTEIRGWVGCDLISADSSQCTVGLDRSQYVIAKFGYLTTTLSAPVHDLSGATVVLGSSQANLTIPASETELIDALRNLQIGDYIVGPGDGGGYLLKVADFVRVDDRTYQLTTEEAGLDELITQGSGGFRKAITNGDLLGYVPPSAANPRARVAENAISGLDGVSLIPSDDPSDRTIRLQLGAPLDEGPNPRVRQDLSVVLWDDTSTGEKLSVQGVLDIGIVPGVDLNYGPYGLVISGLKDFSFTMDIKQTGELKFIYEGAGTGGLWDNDNLKLQIASIRLGSYLFWVGVVPVYVVPEIGIFLSASGQLTASLSAGGKYQDHRLVGVKYSKNSNGGWEQKRINKPRIPTSFKFDAAPTVSLEAEFKGTTEASLQIAIMNALGPAIGAEGYLAVQAALPVYNEDLQTGVGCKDGLEASLKSGIRGLLKWDLTHDVRQLFENKLGLVGLPKFELSFLHREWLLWHAYLAGQCADNPPFLRVKGDDIDESLAYPDREVLEKRFVLTNVGNGKLPWKVDFRDDPFLDDAIITVTPTSGELRPQEFVNVDVSLDTTKLELGTYSNRLRFENTFSTGAWQTARPDGDTIQTISVDIVPGLPDAPVITDVEDQADSFARVHWSYPISPSVVLSGYQIEVTLDPTGQTGWSSLATVHDRDARSRVVSGLPTGTYCFRMHAYGAGNIESAYSSIHCTGLVSGPNRLTIELGSGTTVQENGSTTGTVRRTGVTSTALSVLLANSDSGAATVPGLVTIPAGETSADFPLTPIDNAIADGDKELTLTASAADFESSTLDVTIADDDIAGLTLRVANAGIDESGGTTTATVSHNGDKGSSLTVDLISSIPGQATLPNRVTIPAGQDGVDFEISAVDDSEQDGDQALTLTASAAGYADGTARIIVTDDDTHTGRRLVLDRVVLSKFYGPSDLCPPADAGASEVCIEYSRYASGYQLDDRYTHSEGSGSYRFQEVYVATGWVATDYEVTVTYDSPPTTLIPGEPIPTLHASGTSSGYTDGWYLSKSFTYYVKSGTRNNYLFDSQVWLLNRDLPYDENRGVFSGTETKSTMTDITVPQSAGDGYTIGGKFNWDPGLYIDWIYKLAE